MLLEAHQKSRRDNEVVAAWGHVERESESNDPAQAAEPQNNLVSKFDLSASKLIDNKAEREDVNAAGNEIQDNLRSMSGSNRGVGDCLDVPLQAPAQSQRG